MVQIKRTQTRLDMRHGNFHGKCHQPSSKYCGGIALNDDCITLLTIGKDIFQLA